jgi:integrase
MALLSEEEIRARLGGLESSGRRQAPVLEDLKRFLAAHKVRTGRREGLVFGRTASDPFVPSTVRRRALTAWDEAGLEPISLHEARHTCASTMIDAGADLKQISTAMGHASIGITADPAMGISCRAASRSSARGWTPTSSAGVASNWLAIGCGTMRSSAPSLRFV